MLNFELYNTNLVFEKDKLKNYRRWYQRSKNPFVLWWKFFKNGIHEQVIKHKSLKGLKS
jgi:hypothetical protein